jgi:hypothetical protein
MEDIKHRLPNREEDIKPICQFLKCQLYAMRDRSPIPAPVPAPPTLTVALPPLLRLFPDLASALPWSQLGLFPTPVHRLQLRAPKKKSRSERRKKGGQGSGATMNHEVTAAAARSDQPGSSAARATGAKAAEEPETENDAGAQDAGGSEDKDYDEGGESREGGVQVWVKRDDLSGAPYG